MLMISVASFAVFACFVVRCTIAGVHKKVVIAVSLQNWERHSRVASYFAQFGYPTAYITNMPVAPALCNLYARMPLAPPFDRLVVTSLAFLFKESCLFIGEVWNAKRCIQVSPKQCMRTILDMADPLLELDTGGKPQLFAPNKSNQTLLAHKADFILARDLNLQGL